MVEPRQFLSLLVATALTGFATAATVTREAPSRSTQKGATVTDHIPQFDGPLTMLAAPDGRIWATWANRAAGEFDIAVSSRDASATTWSAPLFFGRRNGADELDPAIAVDDRGSVYVAFATGNPSRVSVAVLPAGSDVWSEPAVVSGAEVASSPALRLFGDRLIVAFRTARGVGMVDFPIVGNGNEINGIQDGPEGVDPLGVKPRAPSTDGMPSGGGSPNP